MEHLKKRQGNQGLCRKNRPFASDGRAFLAIRQARLPRVRLVSLACAGLWALGLVGCGGSRPALSPGDIAGRISVPVSSRQADSLSAIVRRQGAGLISIRGSGDLFLQESPRDHPRRLAVSLAVRRTGQARMSGRFGVLATVFNLRVAADTLEIYFPRDGVLVSGPLSRWKEAPFPGAGQLVELLLPRLPGVDADSTREWRRGDDGWTLTLRQATAPGESLECRQTFEPKRLRLVRQVFVPTGPEAAPPLIVTYDKHRWTGTGWFPQVVSVHVLDQPESCELRFASSSLNGEIPGEVFRMPIPADARRIGPEELSRRLIDETGENEP